MIGGILIFLSLLGIALYPVFGSKEAGKTYYSKPRGWKGVDGYLTRNKALRQKGMSF